MSDQFKVGSKVRITKAYPPGHIRTPFFLRGSLLGFKAILRRRYTSLDPHYRDIGIHTRYHPVYFGYIGPLTSAHQVLPTIDLRAPTFGVLHTIHFHATVLLGFSPTVSPRLGQVA